MRSLAQSILVATLIICFAGCTSLLTSDVPPENIYWLEAPNTERQLLESVEPVNISVRVSAAPGLDTDRLLIRGPGAILNSYAGARWTDNAPEVFDTLIRTTLENSGRFNRVSSGRSDGSTQWSLDLELRAFFAVVVSESSLPTIEIELRGYLTGDSEAISIRIENTASVSQVTLTEIVAGFQNAVDASLTDLSRLIFESNSRP